MAGRFGLQIRTATLADAAGVAELMEAAGCRSSVSAWAARLGSFERENGAVLLACEWGPPSGLVALSWLRTLVDDGPVAQISALVVGPTDRRRGIGRLLLKAGAQAARSAGCGALRLLATEDDPTLLAFASASGFDGGGRVLTRALRKSSK